MCPVEGSSRDECACCHGDPGSRWERGALHFTWWNDSRCREDDERLFRRPPSSSRQSSSSCFRLSTRRAATAAVSHQQPNESGQRWTDGHQRNVWQSQKTSRHLILLLLYIYISTPPPSKTSGATAVLIVAGQHFISPDKLDSFMSIYNYTITYCATCTSSKKKEEEKKVSAPSTV